MRIDLDRAIDKAVAVFSPRRAWTRQHFRRMERDDNYRGAWMLMLRARGYRAAGASNSGSIWRGGGTSADAEILNDLGKMRNHSRILGQNDPLDSGLVKTFVNNVIGFGITVQARTGDAAKDRAMESYWLSRRNRLSPADDLLHGEAQRQLFARAVEDGEVFRKAVYTADEPVWFETIEAERVDTPAAELTNGNIRAGVERDAEGRILAYHINRDHPGDMKVGQTTGRFVRVPAGFVRHIVIKTRPGQTRGVPFFHAIIQDLRDLDLLILASLKRTQIAACLAAFIKSPDRVEDLLPVTADKYGYKLDEAIEPGMLFQLFPGEEIQTLVPNFPTPELGPFIVMLARRIGAAIGVCWQTVLHDFSQSTYSSARTDQLNDRQTFRTLQRWFIDRYLNWEWQTVMKDGLFRADPMLAGVTMADVYNVQWIPPGWEWVDPEKEAMAEAIKLENNLTTLQEVCAARGQDFESIMRQRVTEKAMERELMIAAGMPDPYAEPAEGPSNTARMIQGIFSRPSAEEPRGNGSARSMTHANGD